ncbi:MAG: pentapeptide repeat-containing protein [Oscillatoriaceae bacterium SKW80]|nr:pentapeptide repeat-containing protein [Oscillatoriaceae bacterium SKYG93]MCX8121555.1 pentapeptide repeat-containing protein [Oscillatoriaceae bacterium SKW80]MDW8452858.1 pentapeptide repeat-containing protein [Oscillatoriaceae cyanobacterium SKYGB_i_bin93]
MTTDQKSAHAIQPQSNVNLSSDSSDNPGKDTTVEPAAGMTTEVHPQPRQVYKASPTLTILVGIVLISAGLVTNNRFLGLSSAFATMFVSVLVILPRLQAMWERLLSARNRVQFVAVLGLLMAVLASLKFLGGSERLAAFSRQIDWNVSGSVAEWVGAVGQIFVAILALYIAWRQYIISRDLTLEQNRLTNQQNILTQQQTIDAYFQGISDLALDEEGLLEDWPQERAFSEGRTAAILSSVDAAGKAKVLRFLSRSKLLTPLKRDRHLGRPILNGAGGYEEDRNEGVRVIDLGIMLAGANLSGTDLRWTDLSDANLIRANLSGCELVKANLSRTILYEANLKGANLKGARLFYGFVEHASPRSRTERPNYETGEYTGAVIENADFTDVKGLSDAQRYYCCAWCGSRSRATIPGGCDGIPNKLGR